MLNKKNEINNKIKKIKIRKDTDFNILINNKFEIVFYNDLGEKYNYPLIIEDTLEVNVPKHMHVIENFLNKKINVLHGKYVIDFLKLTKIDTIPFIWMIMQEGQIDIFLDHKEIYIRNQNDFIVLNNRNMDLKIIEKLYRVQNKKMFKATYRECLDELYTYTRKKLLNSIIYNDFVKYEIKRFKEIETFLENEFLNNKFNFPKILFLYENLIRLKEKYTDEQFYLKPQQDIDEIYETLKKIRELLKQNNGYSVIKE